MPGGSVSVQKFVDVLKTGQTDITKAMDQLFANPADLQGTDLFQELQQAGALDELSPLMRQIGTDNGVTDKELDHINTWPNDQKEEVRQKLVLAIENNRPVHFFWEVHRRKSEEIEVLDPDAAGDITVIFISPPTNLHVPDDVTGDIIYEM